jgi:hypothetical protein
VPHPQTTSCGRPANQTGLKYNTGQEKGNECGVICVPCKAKILGQNLNAWSAVWVLCWPLHYVVSHQVMFLKLTKTTLGKAEHTVLSNKVPFFIMFWYTFNTSILIKYPGLREHRFYERGEEVSGGVLCVFRPPFLCVCAHACVHAYQQRKNVQQLWDNYKHFKCLNFFKMSWEWW